MGILTLDENKMYALYSLRSSVESQLKWLCNMLGALMKRVNGTLRVDGEYAAWEYT